MCHKEGSWSAYLIEGMKSDRNKMFFYTELYYCHVTVKPY